MDMGGDIMKEIFSVVLFFSFFGFIIAGVVGLIKPSLVIGWSRVQTKRRAHAFAFSVFGLLVTLFAIILISAGFGWVEFLLLCLFGGYWAYYIKKLRSGDIPDKSAKELLQELKDLWNTAPPAGTTIFTTSKREWETAWDNEIHALPDQQRRQQRIRYLSAPVSLDRDSHTAVFHGTGGIYHTSLQHCDCPDFLERFLPCKHIYRLANELGVFFAPLAESRLISSETRQYSPNISVTYSVRETDNDWEDDDDFEARMAAREENREKFRNNASGCYLDFLRSVVRPYMPEGEDLEATERSQYFSIHVRDQPRKKILCRLYNLVDGVFIEPRGFDKALFTRSAEKTKPTITKRTEERLIKIIKDLYQQ